MNKNIKTRFNKIKRKLSPKNFSREKFKFNIVFLFNFSPPRKQNSTGDNRLKSLQHVRERLDQLEEIVNYYQTDLINEQEEESTVLKKLLLNPMTFNV